jgi:hypothetical protein
MSLDELLPVWTSDEQEELVQLQEAVLTQYLGALVQAVKDISDYWLDLFGSMPGYGGAPWHPEQHRQYTQAVIDMIMADFTTDLRSRLEAQLRRAERHAPDARQLELFPE